MSDDEPSENPNQPNNLLSANARVNELSAQLSKLKGRKKTSGQKPEALRTLPLARHRISELVAEIVAHTEPQASAEDHAGLVAERDEAVRARNQMRAERDAAQAERDQAISDRNAALDKLIALDNVSAERDAAIVRADSLESVGRERDEAIGRASDLEIELRSIPEPPEALRAANAQIEILTGDLTRTKAELVSERTNVSRLEGFCGLKGILTTDLPLVANDQGADSGEALYAQWSRLQGGPKTAFFRKHEAALGAYAERLRSEGRAS